MSYLSIQKDGSIQLRIYVQPKASRNGLVGMHDGCLKLAISSPPVDDKANKSVVLFFAELLGISPKEIVLCSGKKSRRKQLAIGPAEEHTIRRLVEAALLRVENKQAWGEGHL
jgi:uncharacterized protein (TIGR00251 family)